MGLLCPAIFPDLRLALKDIDCLRLSVQHASGAVVLFECHLWLNRDRVEGGCVLNALVDRYGGVDDRWLDDFALDHGLYLLVDMVMRVFAGYG